MNEMSVHLAKQPPSRERPVPVPEGGSIFTALEEAGRVVDFQKATLPLSVLKECVYYLRRSREVLGDRVPVVDCMASRKTCDELVGALRDELRERLGPIIEGRDPVAVFVEEGSNSMLEWVKIDSPESGCQIAVIPSDQELFGFSERDNELVLIDWSDLVGFPPTPLHSDRHLIVAGFSGFSK